MPLFIDSHDVTGVTPEAIADAHLKDVAVQGRYGVRYVKYWMNEGRGKVFCLCTAPDAESANRVHREAHGLVAERIVEIDADLAEGILGVERWRPPARPWVRAVRLTRAYAPHHRHRRVDRTDPTTRRPSGAGHCRSTGPPRPRRS